MEPADRVLVIERIFDAPRPLVFETWTKQEHLEKWSTPHGFTIRHCEGDLRRGGVWQCHMIAPDGEMHKALGVYREIIPPERIVFTHGWEGDDGKMEHETLVTIHLTDTNDGKTKMHLHQAVFRLVESRNGHEGGWSQSLEKLAELLAKIQTGRKS